MCMTAECTANSIACGYEEGIFAVWDTRVAEEDPSIKGCFTEKEDVASVIVSKADENIVYVASGKHIYILDLRKLDGDSWTDTKFTCEDDINQIVMTDNEQMLAVADDSSNVSLYDIKNSSLISRLNKHRNSVSCLKFRKLKQRQLISGGYDCMLLHWDVLKGRHLSSADLANLDDPEWTLPKSFNPSFVLSCDVATVESKETCVAGTENGNLHLFSCDKKLNHIKTFRAHDQGVTQTKYYNNSSPTIFTCSNDKKIKLWSLNLSSNEDTTPNQPIRVIDHHSKFNWITFSSNNIVICDTTSNVTLLPFEI
ncbi:WD repeat-containing protein 53 [Chamberlinius hualienensis]